MAVEFMDGSLYDIRTRIHYLVTLLTAGDDILMQPPL